MTPHFSRARPWRRASGAVLMIAAVAFGATAIALGVEGHASRSASDVQAEATPMSPELAAIASSGGITRYYPGGIPRVATATSPGALLYPPGTSYAAAITDIFVSQMTGRQPSGRLQPPLPKGKVLSVTDNGTAVDLAAPYGYEGGTGFIYTAIVQQSGRLTAAEAAANVEKATNPWPVGSALGVPTLPTCQVVATPATADASCGPRDDVVIQAMGPPLPG